MNERDDRCFPGRRHSTLMVKSEKERVRAVERYRQGERATEICASMGRSVRWLYKWIRKAETGESEWWTEASRRPRNVVIRTESTIEQAVIEARRRLEGAGQFCGAQSIAWELEELAIKAPSIATINRIINRRGLTRSAHARRPAKGKRYPAPPVDAPGQVQQSDFVGPRYLRGAVRFYSFNTVDLGTTRCSTIPIADRSAEALVPALWQTWVALGIPRIQQLDNDLVFFGSVRHPRGLGQILRLCLSQGVEPLFIPPSEPWRNGVVEKFNHHWQQKFSREGVTSLEELSSRSRAFEARHNSRWRYRKHGGQTPNQVLAAAVANVRIPESLTPPKLPLPRPEMGRYHFIRFIRSDGTLRLWRESFPVPSEAIYEYVKATVDVATQQLEIRLDGRLIETRSYSLPR